MKNSRSLFPPLFGEIPTGGGGGGSGNKIQLAELPEASLQYKDRIVQYIGATTEALINGYFYKCVEHTTTEGETITVTYSWDAVDVMEIPTPTQTGVVISETETKIGTYYGSDMYAIIIPKTKMKNTLTLAQSSTEIITSSNLPSNIDELIDVTVKYRNGSSGYNSKGTVKGGFRLTNGSLYWNGGYDTGVNYQYYEDILTILIYTKTTT